MYKTILHAAYLLVFNSNTRTVDRYIILNLIITSLTRGVRGIVMSMSVCLSVRFHISKTARPNFATVFVHVDRGCTGSVLLWRC